MSGLSTRALEVPTPKPTTLLLWAAVIALEIGLILTHVTVMNAELGLFHVYPFVWINVGLWAVWKTSPIDAPRRQELLAGAVAVGYLAVLAVVGGMITRGHAYHDHHDFTGEQAEFVYGLELATTVPPGYGPAVLYSSPEVLLAISPYMLVGYLALAYLVYVTVLDAAGAAVSAGVLGLFTCISCSWPILASLAAGGGGLSGTAATIYAQSYALSTVAFVLTVGLLYWRPFKRAG